MKARNGASGGPKRKEARDGAAARPRAVRAAAPGALEHTDVVLARALGRASAR